MSRSHIRWGFILRGLLISTLLLGAIGLTGFLWLRWISSPPALRSFPEASAAGIDPPTQSKGLQFQSSGFLLQVDEGVYAVTAVHSLMDFWGRGMPAVIPVMVPGDPVPLLLIETQGGDWGRPRWGRDLRVDYALFLLEQEVDPVWVLQPDQRGRAELGEGVWLHGGAGNGADVPGGIVYSVFAHAVWVVMDQQFSPWGMSGSPFISAETGAVVGMAIVTGQQDGHLVIGMHPIGSLVEKIEAAFP